jgi:curved DNA-binding protein CbpA
MVNAFSCLHLPVRPWLDQEQVRNAFHRLASQHHPDRATGDTESFAELTASFETLREPQSRLKHLMNLEQMDAAVGGTIPAELMELFPSIAQARQQLAAAVTKRRAATNALARSLATVGVDKARRSAEGIGFQLDAAYQAALGELARLDAEWPSPAAKAALPALHARFAFLTKWRDQLRESLLQLQLS